MNLFCVVGQINALPYLKETSNGFKTCDLELKVVRNYADSNGEYENDYITVEVWRGLAETICNVAKVGEWVSVKGRIASRKIAREDKTYCFYTFIAENVGFIHKEKI